MEMINMKTLFPICAAVLSASLLVGCDPHDVAPTQEEINFTPPVDDSFSGGAAEASFSPLTGEVPIPTNLFFAGTQDATLEIPSTSAPAQAANAIDGWSTNASLTTNFNAPLDPSTVQAGNTVRMFHLCIDPFTTQPTGGTVDGELIPGMDYTAGISSVPTSANESGANKLVIKLLKPLRPKYDAASMAVCAAGAQGNLNKGNGYMVVLSKGLKTASGEDVGTSTFYKIAKGTDRLLAINGDPDFTGNFEQDLTDAGRAISLTPAGGTTTESVRRLSNGHEQLAAGISAQTAPLTGLPAINPANIILSWSFSTQSIGSSLSVVAQTAQSRATAAAPAGASSPQGAADIYVGSIELPYFLDVPTQQNPTAILTGTWEGQGGSNLTFANPVPVQKSTVKVPMLITVPKVGPAPGAQLPVVIVQHGITSNRSAMLGVADTLAQAGFVAVAIDLPLHGITDASSSLRQACADPALGCTERTFNVDLVNNANSAPGPDGTEDASGAHFINLASLLTSRDNLRQGAADLLNLRASLANLVLPSTDGSFTFGIDANNIRFIGHSLGGIIGTVFLALEPNVGAATLGMPGGAIGKLLDASAAFGPTIGAGLAANGVNEGTEGFEDFLYFAQLALDSGDPINYAAQAAALHPIHLIEVVGGNGNPPDLVVPNDALNPQPGFGELMAETGLGGTAPLITGLGLNIVSANDAAVLQDNNGLRVAVQFSSGSHSSILTPGDGNSELAEYVEMQKQIGSFMSTNGTVLTVNQ